MGSGSGTRAGTADFLCSKLGHSAACLLIILGLPIALGLAWAFELTPEGIKRTEKVDETTAAAHKKRAWIYVVIVGASCIDWIIFSRSLLGCPYATRGGRHFDKIDRGFAV